MSTISAANSSTQTSNSKNNNTMHSSKEKALEPLNHLLSDVLARLEVLESKAGIASGATTAAPSSLRSAPSIKSNNNNTTTSPSDSAAVKGYDDYLKDTLSPFVESCKAIQMNDAGMKIKDAFQSLRFIIVLATRSKKPNDLAQLTEYLKPTQEALQSVNQMLQKLPRDLDRHAKAISEMNAAMSWVVHPFPAKLVKESIASAEFWTNRIKKDHKEDANQVKFCDSLKQVLQNLTSYIQEHHENGLSFTGTSMSLQEAAIRLTDEQETPNDDEPKSPIGKKNPIMGNVVTSGNIAGLMGELTKRQTADGSSAATGLKHVTKDQQTWRKEFTAKPPPTNLPAAPSLDAAVKKTSPKKKPRGLPIFEYQDRGFKWLVENQTVESNKLLTVEITDAKQQVYIYNCENITIKIVGKFKSLAVDNCEKLNIIFDDLISSTEIVNCKKLQIQVTGVCPVFNIDKTINILIYLSKASKDISSFCTSLSSEMNVSFPIDDSTDDLKELPIPEQFVHKIASNGTVTSEVSDLYH